jgi:hypothetical protein
MTEPVQQVVPPKPVVVVEKPRQKTTATYFKNTGIEYIDQLVKKAR